MFNNEENIKRTEENELLIKREHSDDSEDYRRVYAHDRDGIIHSKAFRRMIHKTQIFNANKGDHFRNRLTHTLEVSQIARSLGRLMNLNEDLIEAISLGHDLGHTPFGHIGERTLYKILMNGMDQYVPSIHEGLKHNFQSIRVVDQIENRCDEYLGDRGEDILYCKNKEGWLKKRIITETGQYKKVIQE